MRHSLLPRIVAAALLSACGGDSATAPTPTSIAGGYALVSVDGAPLPAATTKLSSLPGVVLSGSLALVNDGTFTGQVVYRETGPDSSRHTYSLAGRYRIDGDRLLFDDGSGAAALTGSIAGSRITAFSNGAAFVFERQTTNAVAMFDAVWSNYDAIYPEFDYKHVNWDSLRLVYRPRAVAAISDAEGRAVIHDLLAELRDVHSYLTDPSGIGVATYSTNRFVNWRRSVWDAYMARADNHPQQMNWGYATLGGIPYLYFGAWNTSQFTSAAVDAALERFRDAPAMIIDVRPNPGGNEALAVDVATRFYDAAHLYRYGVSRSGARHSDLAAPQPMTASPRGSWQFRKPVLLLVGRGCFSSNEDFTLAMRVLPNVTVVGDTTGGGSGNPGFYDLGGGWQYTVPRSMDLTPAKEPVEWKGIAPAVVIPVTEDDFSAGRDPVLDYAIAWAKRFTTPS